MLKAGSATTQKLIDALMGFRKLHWLHHPVEGLRRSEFWVLITLKKAEEDEKPGVRISDLARRLSVATPTATQVVKRLESTGHVERKRSGVDKRIVHVFLTEKGTQAVDAVHENVVSHFDAVVNYLGEEESAKLAQLLTQVTDFLKDSVHKETQ